MQRVERMKLLHSLTDIRQRDASDNNSELISCTEPLDGIVCSRIGKCPERIVRIALSIRQLMNTRRVEGRTNLVGQKTAISQWAIEASVLWKTSLRCMTKDPSVKKNEIESPDIDRQIVWLADRLYAPYVRKGGRIERYIQERLRLDPLADVHVGEIRDGDRESAASRLYLSGAKKLNLELTSSERIGLLDRAPSVSIAKNRRSQKRNQSWEIPNELSKNQWLFHCTRAPNPLWPGETKSEYMRAILCDPKKAHLRTTIDTLRRIISMGELTAQASASKQIKPVVCFSNQSLAQLLAGRCYRPHLQRWDYEPYGVAITKRYALSNGAKKVKYIRGEKCAIHSKSAPFYFHPSGKTYDWTKECEWRFPETILLRSVPYQDVRFFAEDSPLSRKLLADSHWKVHFLRKLRNGN